MPPNLKLEKAKFVPASQKLHNPTDNSVGGHVDGAIDTVGHLGSMAGSAIGNFFGNLG